MKKGQTKHSTLGDRVGKVGTGGNVELTGSESWSHSTQHAQGAHHAYNEDSDIPIIIHMNDSDITRIIDKALSDGSCLHWCYDIQQKHPDARYLENEGVLMVFAFNNVYELTKQRFIHGIQQALPYLSPAVIQKDKLDVSLIDSDGADLITQLALFDQLVHD